jgi:hypothetical protein
MIYAAANCSSSVDPFNAAVDNIHPRFARSSIRSIGC